MLKKLVVPLFFLIGLNSLSHADDFVLGVNSHLYAKKNDEIITVLNKIKALNIKAVRIDAPWKLVEREKGIYQLPPTWDTIVDYSKKNNIDVLFILDYGNVFYDKGDKPLSPEAIDGFVNYANFITKHFGSKVKYYQIWNEWNNHNGSTSPGLVTDYKKLVKATYPIIKRNSAESVVITSSFSPAAFNKAIGLENRGDYFKEFLTPDMVNYTDALSIHPYTTYRKPPFHQFKYYTKQINYAMNLVKNSPFKNKPLFITEIGWTTSESSVSVSLDTQANDLKKAICEAKSIGYAGVFIYELRDNKELSTDPEDGFGILDSKLNNKPAANQVTMLDCN